MLWACRPAPRAGWHARAPALAGCGAGLRRRMMIIRRLNPPSPLAPDSLAPPLAQASPLLLAAMRTLLPQGPSIVRVSKLHTPEVLVGRNELDPHVPTVRPLHSFPDDVSIHGT